MADTHRHHWRRFYLVPDADPSQINGLKVYTDDEPEMAYHVGWDCECGEAGFSSRPPAPLERRNRQVTL